MHIEGDTTIFQILTQLDIRPDTCLTLIDNNPVPIDTLVENGQTLTLVEVTSGG